MQIWKYGIGILLVILVIWAIKASYQTRVLVSIGVIAALIFLGTKKRS